MRVEAVAFAISLAVNAWIVGGFDRALDDYGTQVTREIEKAKQKDDLDALEFQYIESPPKTAPEKPLEPRKISDRDSVAQDETPDKTLTRRQDAPRIETQAHSDQLEQQRFDPAAAPQAASKPMEERLPSMETTRETPKEEVTPPSEFAESIEQEKTETPEAEVTAVRQAPSKASPASEPQAPRQGLSGRDKITTQAFSRQNSSGAQIYGVAAYEAMGTGMGTYMKHLKEKIWLTWFPYLSFHYPKDFRSADAVIEFTLDKSGQVKAVRIADQKGSPLFASFCVEAIQRAAPFGPLPQDVLDLMGRDDLEINFAFHYW